MCVDWRLTMVVTAAVCVLSAASAPLHTSPRAGQTPTFKSGVELVMIDATVIDDNGRPIVGLGADGFEVSVDGKRRRVVSAQFVDLSVRPPRSGLVAPSSERTSYSANDIDPSSPDVPPERFIVLAVDHSSFAVGGGRQTLEAARRFLSRLDPSDRVGLASYPDPGTFLLPTTDHAAIAGALRRVVGSGERIEPTRIDLTIGLSEALDIDGGDQFAFERVVTRECAQGRSAADVELCRTNIESDARLMVAQLRMRGTQSLNGLLGLLDSLKSINGRKTLILISAGLIAADERSSLDFMGELRAASQAAGAANTVIHALHVDTALLDAFGADRSRSSPTAGRDASLMATGLDMLVGLSGGGLFRVAAGAEPAFERITREIAAYYVLGIEPEATDRDGKAHTIKVRVSKPGLTVRSRQQFTLEPAAAVTAPASPEQTLAAAIASGHTYRDLPLRVSTQTLRDLKGDNVRVLVRADIGRDVTSPADLRVGLAFFDQAGQLIASAMQAKRLVPTRGRDASWTYLEHASLRPGPYTLRVGVMDGEGRIGSVAHHFVARLESGVTVQLSDLLVFDSERAGGDQLASIVDGRIRGSRLATIVEVYPEKMSSVSSVLFAVGGSADGSALLTVPGVITARAQEQRVQASAEFDLRLLPPGDYVVTATALGGTAVLGRVSRPITLMSSAGSSSDSLLAASESRLPFAPGDAGGFARRFARADVLRPDTLTYFLGRLRVADTQVAAPAVTAAADATARGEFEAALELLKHADGGGLSVNFLKGLALYAKGELEPAAFQFRAALHISSSFLPAAFYLGACYAAGGRDDEAAGAWQTSLISEGDARIIFDVLADAWLRLKDGPQAMAILTEARERWPDDDVFLPRLAAAQVMLKQPGPAMDTLETYIGRHADDTDVIFLALRLLYDAHANGSVMRGKPEDAALAAKLAMLYRAAAGPHVALADRWVAFIR